MYQSSNDWSVEGLPEVDTPKPLRVVKRSDSQTSYQSTRNTLRDIGNTIPPEYHHTIPKRISSISRLPGESSEDSNSYKHSHTVDLKPRVRPSGSTKLVVQKRRRDNTTESTTATNISPPHDTCSQPPAQFAIAPHSSTRHVGQQLYLKNPPVKDFTLARAHTDNLKNHISIESVDNADAPIKPLKTYGHRRIKSANLLTAADSSPTKLLTGTATIVEAAKKLQKRGTDKASLYTQQFLHRLGSGLPGLVDSHTGMDAPEVQEKAQSALDPPSHKLKVSKLTRSSSTNTSLSRRSDLAETIAAFPSPPRSSMTSFTRTNSSNRGSQIRTQVYISPPEASPIATARLSMTPEMEILEDDGRRSLFVAVDIEGIVPALESTAASLPRSRLNIAIVIDNS